MAAPKCRLEQVCQRCMAGQHDLVTIGHANWRVPRCWRELPFIGLPASRPALGATWAEQSRQGLGGVPSGVINQACRGGENRMFMRNRLGDWPKIFMASFQCLLSRLFLWSYSLAGYFAGIMIGGLWWELKKCTTWLRKYIQPHGQL